MSSISTPKSHFASITSSPLLTMVAESIVILRPIDQFGCFNASSTLTFCICSLVLPLKGPPDAVSRIFSIVWGFSPFKDWKIALCSLSTGSILTLCSLASGIIICPAVTRVSLFASAMSCPVFMASTVGTIPSIPTTALTTIRASATVAARTSPSAPKQISYRKSGVRSLSSDTDFSSATQTSFGLNSLICSAKAFILRPAARATTSISLLFLTTSKVWVPMEPVEPKTDIFFIYVHQYRNHCITCMSSPPTIYTTGATNIMLSKRSSIPPCPGIRWL